MTDRDDFLTWVETALYDAELALHNGQAAPRRALWSLNEPVSVLGAWRDAHGQAEVNELFGALESVVAAQCSCSCMPQSRLQPTCSETGCMVPGVSSPTSRPCSTSGTSS